MKSVRARVVNLTQFRPELTVAQLRQALVEAFGRVYGLPVHPLRTDQLDAQALARGRARFADPAWVYGDSRPLAVSRGGPVYLGTAAPGLQPGGGGVSPRRLSGRTGWRRTF